MIRSISISKLMDIKEDKIDNEETIAKNCYKDSDIELELNLKDDQKLTAKGYGQFEFIGHGTYGHIFRANWSHIDGQVAIKTYNLTNLGEAFVSKFLVTELEFIRTVPEHNHIIDFYEIIQAPNDPMVFITMQYCPNGDLYDYMTRRREIPEREAGIWFRQLIGGVDHIHSHGFAHRDLKCENLLLDEDYNLKISDFGMCCRLRFHSREESLEAIESFDELPSVTNCGSYSYASPELLKLLPYQPTKNDIWSCGVILYTMLFGSHPNDGLELQKFIQQKYHCIEAPKTSQVSEECKHLVKNILVDEEDRYTIDEIKQDEWFNWPWEQIDREERSISERSYYKNLNVPRCETTTFETILVQYQTEDNKSSDSSSDTSDSNNSVTTEPSL